MRIPGSPARIWFACVLPILAALNSHAAETSRVAFEKNPGELLLTVDGEAVAKYVYDDEVVRRPYFASVRAPGGIQVTRNHPPIEGTDATDHATYHPGIWMAFGDLGGSDYWRNRARVVHDGFVEEPRGGDGRGSFAVRNVYQDEQDPERVVCREECRLDFYLRPGGNLLLWDSTFSNDERPFAFGDQEEMGLGVRVATPITEQNGGTIRDSDGRTTAEAIWGKTAAWCDYSGTIEGRRVGVTLLCHPNNFRPSWMHARDYGLVAANPFGREAFGHGPKSSVAVEKGEGLQLRYGVWIYAIPSGKGLDVDTVFADYVKLASRDK